MKTVKSTDFDLNWNNILSDYITAVNWSPDGSTLAINSAGGEVKVFVENELIALQEVTNLISCTNVACGLHNRL